jgi:preprotein translocase subunit SecE
MVPFTGAFAITALIFLGATAWIYLWQQKPKVADFIIDVEGELKKVTWPTMQEVVNASIVVVICVVVLMGFLAGGDFALGKVVKRLIFGWGY